MYSHEILGTDQNHRIVENGESPVRQHNKLITQSLNGDCLKGKARKGYRNVAIRGLEYPPR